MGKDIQATPIYSFWQFLLAGTGMGLVAFLLFGFIHSITLVPIWTRLINGLPFCLITGATIGWLRYEMQANGQLPVGIMEGLRFGFLLWMTVLPMNLMGLFLRITAIHNTENSWEVIAESILSFASGIICGYLIHKRFRFILAFGFASMALALTQAGPIAMLNNARSAWFFVALGAVYVLSGFLIQLLEKLTKSIQLGKS